MFKRAGRPRSQGKPLRTAHSRDRGHLARINTPVGLRPTCGRAARAPRNPSAQRIPGIAGILPASTHRWACGPLAGGPPALPGTPPHSAFPGSRASCPHQHTGGPAAHLRAGRPRSQEPLRSVPFPGSRASCPHQHTGGPSAHLRAGRPRSQEPLRTAHSRDRGHLARINTPVGLRPTCGWDARAPRNPSARCLSRDRGHLARINTPVGLRPTCGRAARAPRGGPRQSIPTTTRASASQSADLRRDACGTPVFPGSVRRKVGSSARAGSPRGVEKSLSVLRQPPHFGFQTISHRWPSGSAIHEQ